MPRYFIELSYNGTNYHGWQVQPNASTVQGVLDQVLSRVLRQEISTTGSGRTDTGVHALQQFAHFDTEEELPEEEAASSGEAGSPGEAASPSEAVSAQNVRSQAKTLPEGKTLSSINALLPNDVAVRRIIKVDHDAHARFDAISRSYQYRMHFVKDPFLYQRSWRTRNDFNLELMNLGAELIQQHTDFASFCKSHAGSKTTVCRLTQARWEETTPDRVVFYISADRFLRNMVRAIVGTLLDLGRGKISLDELQHIMEKGRRSAAGESVPAEGLYLTRVAYPYID